MSKNTSGYIAVTAALIIMAITTLVVFVIGTSSLFSRTNLSRAHFKERSAALAEGCLQVALLRLGQDISYAGAETVTVGSDTCRIVSVAPSSTDRVISIQGQFKNSFTNLKVTIRANDFSVVNREEPAAF